MGRGLKLLCCSSSSPDQASNAPGHSDDDSDARFYDRQRAYVHARGAGDSSPDNPPGACPKTRIDYSYLDDQATYQAS